MCSLLKIKKGPGHNGAVNGIANDDDRKIWSGGKCVKIPLMKKGKLIKLNYTERPRPKFSNVFDFGRI